MSTCLHCNTPFPPSITGRPALGCSTACKKAIQKARQAENKAKYKQTRAIFRQCLWCLQLFEVYNHKPKSFCDRACYWKHRKWLKLEIPVKIKEKVLAMLEAACSASL